MGLIKGTLFALGAPVRPSTTRERSRKYQRQANSLLEEIADGLASGSTAEPLLRPRVESGGSPSPDFVEQLARLAGLKESGALSDSEYEAAKDKVLGQAGISSARTTPAVAPKSKSSVPADRPVPKVATTSKVTTEGSKPTPSQGGTSHPRQKGNMFERIGNALNSIADKVDPPSQSQPSEVSPESDECVDFILSNPGKNKIEVIKKVSEHTGLDLNESKALVDSTPSVLGVGIPRSVAASLQLEFERLGARVVLDVPEDLD